jgi:HK97 family phage portal protein
MGFFNLFSTKKQPEQEETVQEPSALTIGPNVVKVTRAQKELMTQYTDGGNNLAKGNEENFLSTSELVFSCVDYIGKAASQATPILYSINPRTQEKRAVKDKKLQAWVGQPNPFWTWGDLIELTVQGLLLSGGSFLTHELSKGTFETWFLGPPSKVDIVPDKSKYIKGYIYDKKISYKTDEVCYIKNPTLNNAYYGMPAVRPLFDTLSLEASAIDELQTFFNGSTILTGILKSELPLSPDQVDDLREQFNSLYGASGKYKRGTAVLPSKMDYKQVQATPKDAMLIESMDLSEQRVLRVFKLNAMALGGENSSTTHPQELMRSVFNTAVRPYLYKIAAQMTLFLQIKFKDPNIRFEFDFDKVVELETSLDTKSSAAKTLYTTGVSTLNESRDLVGLSKLDSEYADMNIVAGYLFGENFQYIQEISKEDREAARQALQDTGTNAGTTPVGSTDPEGGEADMPTGEDASTSNNAS